MWFQGAYLGESEKKNYEYRGSQSFLGKTREEWSQMGLEISLHSNDLIGNMY